MITIKKLESGYFHIRGVGPCEWTQPPIWPSSDVEFLRLHAFPQASEAFLREVAKLGAKR